MTTWRPRKTTKSGSEQAKFEKERNVEAPRNWSKKRKKKNDAKDIDIDKTGAKTKSFSFRSAISSRDDLVEGPRAAVHRHFPASLVVAAVSLVGQRRRLLRHAFHLGVELDDTAKIKRVNVPRRENTLQRDEETKKFLKKRRQTLWQ